MKIKSFLRFGLALLFVCLASQHARSQQFTLKHDTHPFEGIWVAAQGDMTYELTIKKELHYMENFEEGFEFLFGGLVYKRNGVIVREIAYKGADSDLWSRPSSETRTSFHFSDKERKMAGFFRFILDPEHPGKATSELIERGGYSNFEGWGKAGFDLPTELEWTKVE